MGAPPSFAYDTSPAASAEHTPSQGAGLPVTLCATHRYRLEAPIGAGGSGTVYRATRIDSGEAVAVKLLREDPSRNAGERSRARERFHLETRLCASLDHPHVVALLDQGRTEDGAPFAVFELVQGRTLRDLLVAEGPMSAATTGRLMTQVLEGLAAAHDQGVVHRDLKPQNIMVTVRDGALYAKILDFGIGALLSGTDRQDGFTLTQAGELLGSPQYCAPEQLRNEPPSAQSDLYAWGLVVIECLTGRPVMQGSSVADILCQQLSPVDIALPSAIAAHPLGTVLRRALSKDPRQRAESAHVLVDEFRSLHFTALVGSLDYRHAARKSLGACALSGTPGLARQPDADYRQITALCCRVAALVDEPAPDSTALLEELERYEALWLTRCSDIAVGYGAQVVSHLGDTALFFFDSQYGEDKPARRAARAALDMMRHSALALAASNAHNGAGAAPRWRVELSAAIHVGPARARGALSPAGVTPSTAAKLMRLARPGDILLTEAARRSLERYAHYARTHFDLKRAGCPPEPVYALCGERHEHTLFDALEQSRCSRLVGREREYAALLRACDTFARARVARGRARGLPQLVVGDAGIGKSRLVYEVIETIRARGHASLYCTCLSERRNHALFPILRALAAHWQIDLDGNPKDALAAIDTMIAASRGDHAAIRATLGAWLGVPSRAPDNAVSNPRGQALIFDVLRQLIVSLGQGRPVLLVVEDVQWIDPTSFELLKLLQHPDTLSQIGVILTSRPEGLARWRGATTRMTLRRLSRDDTRDMLASLLDRPGINPASLDLLAERTAGIPLFVEEIVRELIISGALTEPGQPLHELSSADHYPLPSSLKDMLELAFDRIDGARDTAQLAATFGMEVDGALLAAASPHGSTLLNEHLRRLQEARLIYARHRLGSSSYTFRHALIRDAAYESMSRSTARRNHAQVARTLAARRECTIGPCALSVAEHFALAGAFAEALAYGITAAQRALERGLHDDAIALIQRARQWLAHCDHREAANERTGGGQNTA